MTLQPIDIVNGILSIICVVVSLIIGLTLALNYRKNKQRTLVCIGYTMIGIFTPWWPSSLSFVIALFNGDGLLYYPSIYFFVLGYLSASIAIADICGMVDLLKVKEKNKKPIILIVAIINIIVEAVFLILIFVEPDLIGDLTGPIDVSFKILGKIWAANLIVLFLLTFSLFSIKCIKSTAPEIRVRGFFVLVGTLSFSIAAIFDSILTLDIIGLTIARMTLITSVILLYCGFLLPEFLKKRLVK